MIRPTKLGMKWLFVGGETTGQRAAIICTLVECAKRHGHDPEAYLTDVLERLPAMTNQDDLTVMVPANWQAERDVSEEIGFHEEDKDREWYSKTTDNHFKEAVSLAIGKDSRLKRNFLPP